MEQDRTDEERLSKVLARSGVASRRACEELIFEGRVRVNGRVALLPQEKVSLACDTILVDSIPIEKDEKKFYFILNKPKGYICSSAPLPGKKMVVDLFADIPARLFTVGRLDRDTTGLLLVTSDGHFAQEVIHPSKGHTKEYLIKVQQEVLHEHLASISEGMRIEGTFVKPKKVMKVRKGSLKVVVAEGKKREVRLLVLKAGLTIQSLHRIRVGPLSLGDIPLGAYRELTPAELKSLLSRDKRS